MADRLAKLEQQKARIERQIAQARARVKTESRKQDTRRKIILGGLVEKHCSLHPESAFAGEVAKLIEAFVTGKNERELFGLAPLPKPGAVNDQSKADRDRAASL